MKRTFILGVLTTLLVIYGCSCDVGQGQADVDKVKPVIAGYGVDMFEVGELLYSDDFSNLDDWIVQIQPVEGFGEPAVAAADNVLDAYLPARGCTIWNKNKFHGRIAIVYEVVCPEAQQEVEGLQVRDINNFWHAGGSKENPDLFDDTIYDGSFGNYSQILCYYASTGGGGAQGNQTTRFRRYPRISGDENVDHISLTDKDGKDDFLITPDKTHTIQLVAFDDIIQYIVDGVVVYEIKYGDTVSIETRNNGKIENYNTVYNEENFPYYTEGYFGFRMVQTHHLYSNFKVYRLLPIEK